VYLNLRMGRGRSKDTISVAGNDLLASARAHFEPQLTHQHIGVTLQIDEGPEVFAAREAQRLASDVGRVRALRRIACQRRKARVE
jgi:5-carboxymethyl-2-hydroxymuconate isomerase